MKFTRIATSLLLSLLILVSGSGLIIGKMVCLDSGHVKITASEAKDCCADENGKPEFKKQCCAINNVSFTQSQFETRSPVVVKSIAFSSPVLFSDHSFAGITSAFYHTGTTDYSPPCLSSSSPSLPLLCVFRI